MMTPYQTNFTPMQTCMP